MKVYRAEKCTKHKSSLFIGSINKHLYKNQTRAIDCPPDNHQSPLLSCRHTRRLSNGHACEYTCVQQFVLTDAGDARERYNIYTRRTWKVNNIRAETPPSHTSLSRSLPLLIASPERCDAHRQNNNTCNRNTPYVISLATTCVEKDRLRDRDRKRDRLRERD